MKNTANLDSTHICEKQQIATRVCHTKGRDDDMGQALLELALVLPFLLLLLIGAVEFGIVAYASIEVANAAAAGAQYGAQNRTTASDNANITLAAQNDASNLVTLNVPQIIQWCACQTGAAVSVSGNAVKCSSFAAASCVSPSRVVEWVQVDTSSTIDPTFHYPGLAKTFTLKGHATMRVGQ